MFKMFKTIICLMLVCALLFPILSTIQAAPSNITVTLNGAALRFDVAPIIISGRAMVPARGILEAMGARVGWDAVTQTVTATKGNQTVRLVLGQTTATVNGQDIKLDVPPHLVSGRTLVPLRFVSQALGAFVDWSPATRAITITLAIDGLHISSTTGQLIWIGMNAQQLRAVLGLPLRVEPSLYGYDWWVYHPSSAGVLLVGVANNTIVTVYTDSKLWTIAGITPGDSHQKLTAAHAINDEISFPFQQADITVSLSERDISERPSIVRNNQAVTFLLDTGRHREVLAVHIMALRNFLSPATHYKRGTIPVGKILDLSLPTLSDAEKQKVFRGQERILFDLANAFRVRNGVAALKWHDGLAGVARSHSLDMVTHNFFAHISPQTGSPSDRVERANISFTALGENLAMGTPDAIGAHHGLVNSSGHRRSLLDTRFTLLGTGVVERHFTQKFGDR